MKHLFASVFILVIFMSENVLARDCGELRPNDRYEEVNKILRCLAQENARIRKENDRLKNDLNSFKADPFEKSKSLKMTRNGKCLYFPPHQRKMTINAKPGHFFCTDDEKPFLAAISMETKRGKYVLLQDGTRKFKCFVKQTCEIKSAPLFEGEIYISSMWLAFKATVTKY